MIVALNKQKIKSITSMSFVKFDAHLPSLCENLTVDENVARARVRDENFVNSDVFL